MYDWIVITVLLLLGFGLIIVELLFVPGTTIVGIFGVLMSGFAIYYAYDHFGTQTGTIVMVSSVGAFLGLLWLSFYRGTWKKLSLNKQIDSKFNEGMTDEVNVGDRGVAISTIKPIGNVDFDGKFLEVTSQDDYIESGQNVEVILKDGNQIIVKKI